MNDIVVKIKALPRDNLFWVYDQTHKLSFRAPPERFPPRVRDIVQTTGVAYYRIKPGANDRALFGDRLIGNPGWD